MCDIFPSLVTGPEERGMSLPGRLSHGRRGAYYCPEYFMSLRLCGCRFCKNKSVTWKVVFVVSCSGDPDVESDLAQVQALPPTRPISFWTCVPLSEDWKNMRNVPCSLGQWAHG